MERVKRFVGVAKGAPAAPVRREEDESLVLFGELYKNEKEQDVNLLEPMFSVEFEAIPGDGRMFKLPSGKRDYILPDGEKHDYDWLKTPPATPLFPSLDMEANSSQMIFQRELPILQPVRTSRFSRKPDSTTTSTRSESPTSSSSKSVTPTERPNSSSKKNRTKGASAPSIGQESAYRIDKRSSYTPLTNRQHDSVLGAKTATTTTAIKASKKTSGNKPTGRDNTNGAKNMVKPDKALKNITSTATKPRSNDSPAGAKDLKADASKTSRVSRPPPGTIDSNRKVQLEGVKDTVATKGKREAGTGSVPAILKGAGSTEATTMGRRRSGGEKEERPPKLRSHC